MRTGCANSAGTAGRVGPADSSVTVAGDLAAMAPLLRIEPDKPPGELAAMVVAALGERRDWLVVFDNAQTPADLAGMLPRGGGDLRSPAGPGNGGGSPGSWIWKSSLGPSRWHSWVCDPDGTNLPRPRSSLKSWVTCRWRWRRPPPISILGR